MNLTSTHIPLTKDTITQFLERTQKYLESCPREPMPGSSCNSDLTTSKRPESITTAISIADLALEYGSDHLSALSKLLTEPIETFACYTCIRSMLETVAIGAWLLEPKISSHDRIARVYAIRYGAIKEELKFGRCIKQPAVEIQSLEDRLMSVESEAIKLGYPPIHDGSKIAGIGVRMPSATDMIRDVLGDEWLYRLLSGVAHGQPWALMGLGFCDATRKTGPMEISGIKVVPNEKIVNVNALVLVGLHGILAFSRLIWNKAHYFGWNSLDLEEILEDIADKIHAQSTVRFWRSK